MIDISAGTLPGALLDSSPVLDLSSELGSVGGLIPELGVFRKPAGWIWFLYDFSTKQHFLYETT